MEYTLDTAAAFVRNFWKFRGYEDDVICCFDQKYRWEENWHTITVIASPDDDEPESPIFSWDFCEGETNCKDMVCMFLDEAGPLIRNHFKERR